MHLFKVPHVKKKKIKTLLLQGSMIPIPKRKKVFRDFVNLSRDPNAVRDKWSYSLYIGVCTIS